MLWVWLVGVISYAVLVGLFYAFIRGADILDTNYDRWEGEEDNNENNNINL